MTDELALAHFRRAKVLLKQLRFLDKSLMSVGAIVYLLTFLLGFAVGGQLFRGGWYSVILVVIAALVYGIHVLLLADRDRIEAQLELVKILKQLKAEGHIE